MKLNPLLGYLMGGIVFGGGGGGVVPPAPPTKKEINFYDFDGTLLYGLTVAEANALTALPEPPDHSTDDVPLTFQEWNYTLEQITSTATPIDVGATYITTDGKTHFKIRITKATGDDVPFTFKKSNSTDNLKIQFGTGGPVLNNDSDEDVTFNPPPSYFTNGDYDVSVWLEGEGTFSLGHTGGEACVGQADPPCLGSLLEVRIGQKALVGLTSFYDNPSLSVTSIPVGALSSAVWSWYMTALGAAVIPRGTMVLGAGVFADTRALRMVSLPLGLTEIGERAISHSPCLRSIVIPSSVTTISSRFFSEIPPPLVFDFSAFSTVPALSADDHGLLNPLVQIKVPSALVDTWKAADYWSGLADYIVGV